MIASTLIASTAFASDCSDNSTDKCLTAKQVATAWDNANPSSSNMCVTAVAVAFGESAKADTNDCPTGKPDCFNLNATNGGQHGLWQLGNKGIGSAEEQASSAYAYTTTEYCTDKSGPSWGANQTAIPGLPNNSKKSAAYFCEGAWTGIQEHNDDTTYYSKFIVAAQKACNSENG